MESQFTVTPSEIKKPKGKDSKRTDEMEWNEVYQVNEETFLQVCVEARK